MNNLLHFMCFLAMALISCRSDSKEVEVPEAVKLKFSEIYPQAPGTIDWEMKDSLYEGSFKEANMEKAAGFRADGTLMFTENTYDPVSLLPPIQDYVAQHLGHKAIEEASIIRYADGSTGYEIEVGDKDYLFDGSGAFVKMEKAEQEEDD